VSLVSKPPFDRARTLENADRARAKGRRFKAIEEYQQILAHQPNDAAVHGKLAPLLAAVKRRDEARKSFLAAGDSHTQQGFADRAIAVYLQALALFPRDLELWEKIIALHLQRGRQADALKAVLAARAQLHGRVDRPLAIRCLRRALELAPDHVPVTADLARLLAKEGSGPEALDLLRNLLPKVQGGDRRRLHRAEFSVSHSPAALWRSWFGG
jgi:tetratricopeptide (TPR) repeat protein